eukprot:5959886-Alexandrium_andersonii.AAC.1
MSASLVGSEMCIRDRYSTCSRLGSLLHPAEGPLGLGGGRSKSPRGEGGCLLYTSDAADDM